jgi:hypothetical protein
MGDIEDKLNTILSNPAMMQQIMALAQSMGQDEQKNTNIPLPDSAPEIDLGMIQRLSGLAQSTGVDKNQQVLLNALCPYLSRDRIGKLEKAMRAAKMAKLATGIMGNRSLFSI